MPARFAKDTDAIIVGAEGCHLGGQERAKQLHPLHLSAIGKHGANTRWDPKYSQNKKSFNFKTPLR